MYNKYVLFMLLLCAAVISAFGQTEPAADSLLIPRQADSLPLLPLDTLLSDTLLTANLQADTIQQQADTLASEGDIETTVNYKSTDSLRFDVKDQTVYMYGNAQVDYGKIKLEASEITTNWNTQLLTAIGAPDTAGKIVGKPVFTDGPETFTTDKIRYNFKTRKAIIKGIVTQQQEAFIHGETVKKTPDNALMISRARYTTCNLEEPHFHIEAEKLKVLPNDKIISGPFHLRFADVPTPLGFLFGMFPAPRKRVSGILIPSYGEERNRGFFLREGGYYLALNEYVDLALTGEIYSRGSRGIALASNYRKRYAYNGNFNIRYNRQNTSENEAIENISQDVWVSWSHSPQSKGKGRFSASVNGGTSTYTTNNPSIRDIERNLNQQFNSNISYSYSNIFNSPFSFSSRANLVQDISRKTVDLTLPDVSIMMNRQFPFRGLGGSGKSWYEQISVGYTFNATNRLSNKPPSSRFGFEIANPDPLGDSVVGFNLDNLPIIWDRARIGGRHTIPISTSFNILKYFQVSPSFTYDEFWFLKKLQYTDADPQTDTGVRIDTVGGFSRAGVWNVGTGLSTKLFGTFYFNKKNPEPLIQAIRHMVVPSVSFNYRPDFTRDRYGYFQEVRTGGIDRTTGLERIQTLSVYNAFAYSVPGGRESGAVSFGITNNLEMKVRSRSDTAVEYKKIPILKNISINTSYDLIAEEFKLSPLRISGNTSFLNNLISLNFGTTLNPYAYVLDSVFYNKRGERQVKQEMVDVFSWDAGQGIGRFENANFNISTNLSPSTFKKGGKDKNASGSTNPADRNPTAPTADSSIEEDLAYIYDDPNQYVDFTIPWTLRFNYTFNYSKLGFAESNIRQSSSFSGDIKVTDKWKIGFQSGFDFRSKQFTQTSLSIYRDLHCWQMNVSWIPFGAYQSFSVDINVKASVLQDLKLSRRRSWFDQ